MERIITALTGNANFPDPWPSTVPTLAQIQTDLDAFQSALNDTAAGDKTRVLEREAARGKLATELPQLALYLQTAAQGDVTKLGTSGFPLRQSSQRATLNDVPGAPEQFTLSRGTLSGTIVASAKKVPKAASYDAQVTTADPTVEGNWTAAGSFTSCRRIELQGLTPGKICWVRVRALSPAGSGAWTPPTSLMVV